MTVDVYYFGCLRQAGHYPFTCAGQVIPSWEFEKINPWGNAIDGGLCPPGRPQVEGLCSLRQRAGWTALSFWDRTVDSRGGSNSNFVARGTLNFAEMLAIAHRHFPFVIARFSFPLVETEEAAP